MDYYSYSEDSRRAAIARFDEVTRLDPGFAPGFAMAAEARSRLSINDVAMDRSVLETAELRARRAIELDARDPNNLWVGARVQSLLDGHDAAIALAREAIALNPNLAMAHYALGFVLGRAGQPDEALPHLDRALQPSRSVLGGICCVHGGHTPGGGPL